MRFEDKLIENLVFGRSGLNSRVLEKLSISYSCISFIKHCVLRSFCIKMLCFSKIWFFQIFDRSNLLLDQLKLRLKIWFEFASLNRCSIDTRSIKCDFWLIENHRRIFLKHKLFTYSSLFQNFSKSFLALSLFDRSNSS